LVAQLDRRDEMISIIIPTKAITSDEQVRLILRQTAKHEIIHGAEGNTPAEARNIAAREAKGDILVFLDDDCYPTNKHWLSNLTKHSGVTSGRIIQPNSFIGRFITRMGGLGTPDYGLDAMTIGSAPSTNIAIPKQLFNEIGGFNSELVVGEDIDLCRRLTSVGKNIRYEPLAVVEHRQTKIFRRAYHGARHTANQRMQKRKTLIRMGVIPGLVFYLSTSALHPILIIPLVIGLIGLTLRFTVYMPLYLFHLLCESAGAWRGIIRTKEEE